MNGDIFIIVIAVLLGGLRIGGVTHQAFQAFAHLFVGYLFGGAYWQYRYTWTEGGKHAMFMLWAAIALSLLELTVFLIGFFKV